MSATIVVFSDEPILVRGLQAELRDRSVFTSTTYVTGVGAVMEAIRDCAPSVLLLDFTPDIHMGILRELRKEAPSTHIVLWTRSISAEVAYQAIELGVRGVAQKTLPAGKLVECVSAVAEGELWLDKALTMTLLTSKPVKLTPREGELVGLLAQGLKNKEIAARLNISEGTVKVYLSRLFEKVGAKDRFELALFGVRNMRNVEDVQPEVFERSQMGLRSMVMRRYA